MSTPVYKVARHTPELIAPAKSTPHEIKYLSDIDDQKGLRILYPILQFYRKNNLWQGSKDPAKVLREAISRALVFYYPFAGRLREVGDDGKLLVECTGEGVLFMEADADAGIDDFGDVLHIPFPSWEELVFDVPGSSGVVGCPLLLFQVTRLKCGGFVFATRLNHTMCDGGGLILLLTAISEMAQGALAPSIQPVWQRERLSARDPPRVTCVHNEFDSMKDVVRPMENMVLMSFFFGPVEVSAIRRLIPPHLGRCTAFELICAVLWRTRTMALKFDEAEEVRMICVVNSRLKFNPPLPMGYYGNVIAHPAAKTTAGELIGSPLEYALKLIQNAKNSVSEEYMRSLADFLVLNGRPCYTGRAYLVSYAGSALADIDYGWGKAAYGGPARIAASGMATTYQDLANEKGEKGIVVPIYLPTSAMDLFAKELKSIVDEKMTSVGAPKL